MRLLRRRRLRGHLAGSPLAVPVAVVVMLATGLVVGTVNGLSVSRLRMPPFLATLAVNPGRGGFDLSLEGGLLMDRVRARLDRFFNNPACTSPC